MPGFGGSDKNVRGDEPMSIVKALENRRSIYALDRKLPITEAEVETLVKRVTELVPDAFNMKSARVVIVLGKMQDTLWDTIYEAFEGRVKRDKIDGFKAASGTILYFYDNDIVKSLQERFPDYAENFPVWANQANGMLQISVWAALREREIGANLQHYNPVIDAKVKKLLDLPESWVLLAQMPFGGIAAQPDSKEKEHVSLRVKSVR